MLVIGETNYISPTLQEVVVGGRNKAKRKEKHKYSVGDSCLSRSFLSLITSSVDALEPF